MTQSIDTLTRVLEQVKNNDIPWQKGLNLVEDLIHHGKMAAREETLFYKVRWEEMDLKMQLEAESYPFDIILFAAGTELRDALKHLAPKTRVILVQPGSDFSQTGAGIFQLDPAEAQHYTLLLEALASENVHMGYFLHSWSQGAFTIDAASLQSQLTAGFNSLVFLTQALLSRGRQETVRLLYTYPAPGQSGHPLFAALGAFCRSLNRENAKYLYKTVELVDTPDSDSKAFSPIRVLSRLLSEYSDDRNPEVRYLGEERQVKRFTPHHLAANPSLVLKTGGVYLISGGAGRLGLKFAHFIAGQAKPKLVLTDLAPPDQKVRQQCRELESRGVEVLYVPADISQRQEVDQLVHEALGRFGVINGVLHCAGLIRDAYLHRKSPGDIVAVQAPKVWGTIWLDEALRQQPLDFTVYFSSLAALIGNTGQCDYAFANSFMDHYARWRTANGYAGKSLAINWPLWQEGGMRLDKENEILMNRAFGLVPLDNETGLQAFAAGLTQEEHQFLVLKGDAVKIRSLLGLDPAAADQPLIRDRSSTVIDRQDLLSKLLKDLREGVSRILSIPFDDIDPETELGEFGFDSITFTEYSNLLNGLYDVVIMPAVFFEHRTLASFALYLQNTYQDALDRYYKETVKTTQMPQPGSEPVPGGVPEVPGYQGVPGTADHMENIVGAVIPGAASQEIKRRRRFTIPPAHSKEIPTRVEKSFPRSDEPIAIIGMSGVMPQSNNLDVFWQCLLEGKDMISEIPGDRWDWREWYGDPAREVNKTDIKWGGFMNRIDAFDAAFFGISRREAELMDPQQRIFLETVWKTIEDAGYRVSDLSGSRTGLFVGAAAIDYMLLLEKSGIEVQAQTSTGLSLCVLANRISFLLDWHGPSQPVDTACSSSLVAIHRAVESIRCGDCDQATAGGVNVIAHPGWYISFSKTGMLSRDGHCKTFDKAADGYVRGEGCGAIFLKPLSKAQNDGDHIYALIKGSAENHGGHATSLTAPNPNAQAELIVTAWKRANIDPTTVSYIEAHGTGTPLGDPIEINGLKKAFARLYKDWGKSFPSEPHCGIGSVKTYIGHLETAAGIAGILKVLLSLRHKTLPKNLHFYQLNPYIVLENSPFYIVSETVPWPVLKDGDNREIPRRAGVSSFGFGGANAHIVLEEYQAPGALDSQPSRAAEPADPQLIVLSAKNREQLDTCAGNLAAYLEQHSYPLRDIAYTLQQGREPMEMRLAVIVSSAEQLQRNLRDFQQGKSDIEDFYSDSLKTGKAKADLLVEGESGKEFIQTIIRRREYGKLGRLWTMGVEIDWKLLYNGSIPNRLALPTYPFARNRYWIPETNETNVIPGAQSAGEPLHPLLDRNESTLEVQQFKKIITGAEFYLRDHVVQEKPVLPGVVYLEMARAAAALSLPQAHNIKIFSVVWPRAFSFNGKPCEIYIGLYPVRDHIEFEIGAEETVGEPVVYAQGRLAAGGGLAKGPGPKALDLGAIEKRCTRRLEKEEFYLLFRQGGLQYGPSFQPVQWLKSSGSEVLSRLELPADLRGGFNSFGLHPTLLDGALQTVLGVIDQTGLPPGSTFLPFALEELEINGSPSETGYVHVSRVNPERGTAGAFYFDIKILDDQGRVLVTLNRFSVRSLPPGEEPAAQTVELSSAWTEAPLATLAAPAPIPTDRWTASPLLLLDTGPGLAGQLTQRQIPYVQVKPGRQFRSLEPDSFEIDPMEEEHYRRLLGALAGDKGLPGGIIHLWGWGQGEFDTGEANVASQLQSGFYPIFFLARALAEHESHDRIRMVYIYPGSESQPLYAAVSGFARSLERENARLRVKTVAWADARGESPCEIPCETLLTELVESGFQVEVCYQEKVRLVKTFEEREFTADTRALLPLRRGGVYIITGGLGALGLLFARYLAETVDAKLVLTDLSEPDAEKQKKITELEQQGGQVLYVKGDIARGQDVDEIVTRARSRFGPVNGVIHAAGVIRDAYIGKKTRAEMELVLAPKVYGALQLDKATRNEPLDAFVMFSSIAGVLGNAGQSDYAFANRFMNLFAHWRVIRRRPGKTLAAAWPLWEQGGMTVDRQARTLMTQAFGMLPLDTETGLAAFCTALGREDPVFIILKGNRSKIRRLFNPDEKTAVPTSPSTAAPIAPAAPVPQPEDQGRDTELLLEKISQDVLKGVSGILKIAEKDIDLQAEMSEFGFDSITYTEFANFLNDKFNLGLMPSIFFEHPTLESFLSFVSRQYHDIFVKIYGNALGSLSTAAVPAPETPMDKELTVQTRHRFARIPGLGLAVSPDAVSQPYESIAIIGMSGVMPQSDDLEEFWRHLETSRDLISEIPADRWDWSSIYGDPTREADKIDIKWGGFMRRVDIFDARFFSISPREARLMDPQQRIFLETVWKTIEDAGYSSKNFWGSGTGVFVGVSGMDYYELLKEQGVEIQALTSTGSAHSVLPNRISYLLNLSGPSEAIDTACSSSLVAMHRAIEAIRGGDCEMALAGGVSVIISPSGHMTFGKSGMLSKDGRCKTFSREANGYVRGEGCGVVLLKPLSKARADHDHIYAVIKASAVNHGGHVSSLTTPNPNAQADVIVSAWKRAGLDPVTVSCIEAHGTGTSLGDPIEINGLKKAFDQLYKEWGKPAPQNPHCCIGSVKTNIGHLETAAGIAGLIKVLLALKYKKIPGTVHFREINPYIQLDNSPFYITDKTQPWEPPKDNENREIPRRAGISSFGFGGSNAHIVIEEYKETGTQSTPPALGGQHLVVMSAKSDRELKTYAGKLKNFLETPIAPNDGGLRPESKISCDMQYLNQYIQNDLVKMAAEMMNLAENDIQPDEDVRELGFDPVTLTRLACEIDSRYLLGINSQALINEMTSLEFLSLYLVENHEDRVRYYFRHRLKNAVPSQPEPGKVSLADIAYTLQVGRDAMSHRLALSIDSLGQLNEKLTAFCAGQEDIPHFYTGRGGTDLGKLLMVGGRAGQEFLRMLVRDRELDLLAQLWVSGVDIDWGLLHTDGAPRRISLPTYPFDGKRYWYDDLTEDSPASTPSASITRPASINQPPPADVPDSLKEAVKGYQGREVILDILDNHIALVTMQDQENRNMFSEAIVVGLMARFREIRRNKNIKVIIVTGYDKIFCMGGTREQLMNLHDGKGQCFDVPFLYRGMLEADVPVIAAVQGHASGAGLLFGLYADIVIMAEDSVYGAVFMKYGFTPGMGATYILKEKMGVNLAVEMMFTARSYEGEELKRRGAPLIFKKSSAVLQEALTIARDLAEKPRYSLEVLKKELAGRLLDQLPTIIQRELDMHEQTFSHPEVKQRIQRFFDKSRETPPAEPAASAAPAEPVTAAPKKIRLKLKQTPKQTQTGQEARGQTPAPAKKVHLPLSLKEKTAVPRAPGMETPDTVRLKVMEIIGRVLQIPEAELNLEGAFKEMGVDSTLGVEIVRDLNKTFGLNLEAVVIYDYSTIIALSQFIHREVQALKQSAPLPGQTGGPKPVVDADPAPEDDELIDLLRRVQDGELSDQVVKDYLEMNENEH